MGNRAVITDKQKQIGIYLHWDGGRDSVEGFLKYCKFKEYRNPNEDCYGWARMCQVIANYIGGDLSIGIDKFENLDADNWDNGTYVIDENWEICERMFFEGEEQSGKELIKMLLEIDEAQPEAEQLGEKVIKEKLCKENEIAGWDTEINIK